MYGTNQWRAAALVTWSRSITRKETINHGNALGLGNLLKRISLSQHARKRA